MMKFRKNLVLAGLALLVLVTVALPLMGCKSGSVAKTTAEQTAEITAEQTGEEQEIPMDFAYIPAGDFQMGSTAGHDSEKPLHKVTISKGFFMGKTEVTWAEWKAVMGLDKNPGIFTGDNLPIERVRWYDAVVYCNKRSIQEGLTPCYTKGRETNPDNWGKVPTEDDAGWDAITCDFTANGYRLPTEAEWEYAARAGDTTTDEKVWSGTRVDSALKDFAWYNGNSGNKTHEVGTKKANSFGLYDMTGNVWEWCWDWDGSYSAGETTDPTGPASGVNRTSRGGSWYSFTDYSTVSRRYSVPPSTRFNYLGFRVVRSAK